MKEDRDLPALPYDAWISTRQMLHLICQILGKVRLGHHPKINHWWHVPLYVDVRGLSSRAIPHPAGPFELRLDLLEHLVIVEDDTGSHVVSELAGGTSVADVYQQLMAGLERLGYPTSILAVPYDCFTEMPFAECTEFNGYNAEYAGRYARILQWLHREMTIFRGGFVGKSSPVHLFWHSFDLALTFFSGEEAPPMPDADPVTQEAYSHEVISFGFWPGDDEVQMPALYSYTHPLPETLTEHELAPAEAKWQEKDGGVTAILPFESVRKHGRPSQQLQGFLESAYDAGAASAGWRDLTA